MHLKAKNKENTSGVLQGPQLSPQQSEVESRFNHDIHGLVRKLKQYNSIKTMIYQTIQEQKNVILISLQSTAEESFSKFLAEVAP